MTPSRPARPSVLCLTALSLLAALSQFAHGQTAPPKAKDPTVAETRHGSALMGREMPYRVILPRDYHNKRNRSVRYPVLFLLHGLWGDFANWTDRNEPGAFLTNGLIVVTPEGGNGWYVDSATEPGDRYESYLVRELVPEIDSKFRTRADRESRFVAGLSMGGYGALKFGLKHPDLFGIVGSFSGVLDAPLRTQTLQGLQASLRTAFGDYDSAVRAENDLFALAAAVPDARRKALPFIYLDCGVDDVFLGSSREFSKLLADRKIAHEFRQLPGGHSWLYWNVQVREFIRIVEARTAAQAASGVSGGK